ncbi:MAG: membrane dipeptidase [Anaerolineales bacterium]|jgi:membrane dipeptidase
MLIVDAHEDLAWNMISFGRDYTHPVSETRRMEAGSETPARNGDTLLGWREYQQGQVAVIFATLFAAPAHRRDYPGESQVYTTSEEAHGLYWKQLELYHRLVDKHSDQFRLVETHSDLDSILTAWQNTHTSVEDTGEDQRENSGKASEEPAGHPVGLVMLMEGAEGVRSPAELEQWYQGGLRLIGPAWAGTRFCGGTREPGPLTAEGYALLESMAQFGFTLDLSHMDEKAALQALDSYPGPIVATHANALALLKGSDSNRHLSDRVLRGLLERDGMTGVVAYNGYLRAGWKRGDRRDLVSLKQVAVQIDYICQMAGDARHVGLGSDFDGGFGWQSVPPEIDTVADLQKLVPLLEELGYTQADIAAILGLNWVARLREALPESI